MQIQKTLEWNITASEVKPSAL